MLGSYLVLGRSSCLAVVFDVRHNHLVIYKTKEVTTVVIKNMVLTFMSIRFVVRTVLVWDFASSPSHSRLIC